jgi:hypothetical protein
MGFNQVLFADSPVLQISEVIVYLALTFILYVSRAMDRDI